MSFVSVTKEGFASLNAYVLPNVLWCYLDVSVWKKVNVEQKNVCVLNQGSNVLLGFVWTASRGMEISIIVEMFKFYEIHIIWSGLEDQLLRMQDMEVLLVNS